MQSHSVMLSYSMTYLVYMSCGHEWHVTLRRDLPGLNAMWLHSCILPLRMTYWCTCYVVTEWHVTLQCDLPGVHIM